MQKEEFIRKYNLVEIKEDDGFILDLKYATNDNFLNKVLYPNSLCLLRKNTADKLFKVRDELKTYNLKLKIWDAFRPIIAQEKMWNICPNEEFVSNPQKGKSNHCKGTAVDITLCNLDGTELKMPTEFDYFGDECKRSYFEKLDIETKNNVMLLENIMKKYGFEPYEFEWWHFNDLNDAEIIFENFE